MYLTSNDVAVLALRIIWKTTKQQRLVSKNKNDVETFELPEIEKFSKNRFIGVSFLCITHKFSILIVF